MPDGTGRGAGVGRGLGVGGGLGVPHGRNSHQVALIVSTRQPSPEPLLSLAIRQRRMPSVGINGRLTTVVMKPCELPLHA